MKCGSEARPVRRRVVAVALSLAIAAAACGPERVLQEEKPAAGGGNTVGAAGSAAPLTPVTPATPDDRTPATLGHVTLQVIGMTCDESCPGTVRSALITVGAVHAVTVSVDDEAAYVAYDAAAAPDQKAVVTAMVTAIEQVGYKAWMKADGWPDGITATPVRD